MRGKRTYISLLIAIVLIGLLRLLLFNSTQTWQRYASLLGHSVYFNMGRERGIIELKAKGDLKHKAKYLAFGNSQTERVYYDSITRSKYDIEVFQLPGLQVHEYKLYTDALDNYDVDNVLLFLSDIDMAVNPSFSRLKYGPISFRELFEFRKSFEKNKFYYDRSEFWEIFFGKLIPELKYAFIFKALANHYLLKPQEEFNPDYNRRRGEDQVQKSVESFKKTKNKRLSDTNLEFMIENLESFIDYCQKRAWKVFLIEGQYHPDLYLENPDFRMKSMQSLIDLAEAKSHVTFIRRDSIYLLGKDDFQDVIHIYGDSSPKVMESIMAQIN